MVQVEQNLSVIKAEGGAKTDKMVPLGDMQMLVNPKEEWQQVFNDAWRLERDYFYDSSMHGVNWVQVKQRYQKMLDGAATRNDVDFIIGEMLGELNASHTYHGVAPTEIAKKLSIGYIGANWQADGNYYKISKIIRGAPWDAEAHSPLDMPGIEMPADHQCRRVGEP